MTTERIKELEAENAELDKLAVSRWNIISDLQDVIERLTAENERLSLLLMEIVSDAIDMGDYYHVRSALIEQAEKVTEEGR